MKKLFIILGLVIFHTNLFAATGVTIPGSQFPIVTTPSNNMRFLMVYTNGGLDPNPLKGSNATVTFSDLSNSIAGGVPSQIITASNNIYVNAGTNSQAQVNAASNALAGSVTGITAAQAGAQIKSTNDTFIIPYINVVSNNVNGKVDSINGVATNLNVGADASLFNNPDNAALVIRLTNININGMSISMLSSTNEATAVGIHGSVFNTNSVTAGQSFDFGLWSQGFGPDYEGSVGLDLYNRDAGHSSGTSNLPPNYVVNVTDTRQGTVITQPIFGVNSTNLQFELYNQTNNSRAKIPGFIWNRNIGVMPFRNSSTNLTGAGTVSGSGTTITGIGTSFGNDILSKGGFGDFIAVGATDYAIKSVSSSTSATVFGPPISPTFSGSNYFIFKSPITWIDVNGFVRSAIAGDGTFMVSQAADNAFIRLVGNTKDYSISEGNAGEFFIYNASDNTVPLVLTTNGNLSILGTMTVPTNALNPGAASFALGVTSTGVLTTNSVPGGSGTTPFGLVTNSAGADVVVTNAGVNTTISSNNISTVNGTFSGTVSINTANAVNVNATNFVDFAATNGANATNLVMLNTNGGFQYGVFGNNIAWSPTTRTLSVSNSPSFTQSTTPTNAFAGTVVDFSQSEGLTNLGGNLTFTGISGLISGQVNTRVISMLSGGSDRTIGAPPAFRVGTNDTLVVSSGNMSEFLFRVYPGVFSNMYQLDAK